MKKVTTVLLVLTIALSPFFQACSTIIYGSKQDLQVNTAPEGAVARVGTQSCVTPCTLNVSRKERHLFIMQEHVERQYRLTRTRNNFTFLIGNILWGIFPGMIVDSATGAKISLDDVNIITKAEAKTEKRR